MVGYPGDVGLIFFQLVAVQVDMDLPFGPAEDHDTADIGDLFHQIPDPVIGQIVQFIG